MDNTSTLESKERGEGRRSFHKEFKFNVWLAVVTVTYLVTLYLVQEHQDWSPWLKVTVTLLPVLPGLQYLRSGLKLLRDMDELERRIQLEAWLYAAIGTVVVSTMFNVLNANGILLEKYPHGLEMGGTYLVMFFMWCGGIARTRSRYR